MAFLLENLVLRVQYVLIIELTKQLALGIYYLLSCPENFSIVPTHFTSKDESQDLRNGKE